MKLGRAAIISGFNNKSLRAYRSDLPIHYSDLCIGPNSIDVTLHPRVLIARSDLAEVMDPTRPPDPGSMWSEFEMQDTFIIPSHTFILAAVNERFECDPVLGGGADLDIAQMYEGRSTFARMGLTTHLSAGFGDVGFSGAFTLEIFNHSPWNIRLYAGMRVGQVAFEQVRGAGYIKYNGSYSGTDHHNGPVPPALGRRQMF